MAAPRRRDVRHQELLVHLGHAPHDMAAAAIGTDVVEAGEALLQEAGVGRPGLAQALPPPPGNAPDGVQGDTGDDGEDRQQGPDPPVLQVEHHKYAPKEQGAADDLQDELGEEGRQGGDVAVDPFDQLTRRLRRMEGHVEVEGVGSQVLAHAVGRRPAQLLAEIGRADLQHLGEEGDGDEQARQHPEPFEGGVGPALRRRIDEGPDDLWRSQLDRGARHQEDGERRQLSALGAQIVRQHGRATGRLRTLTPC